MMCTDEDGKIVATTLPEKLILQVTCQRNKQSNTLISTNCNTCVLGKTEHVYVILMINLHFETAPVHLLTRRHVLV